MNGWPTGLICLQGDLGGGGGQGGGGGWAGWGGGRRVVDLVGWSLTRIFCDGV